jgi:acyl-CoA synthetase (AMP-forming)/AMP-acid ligase II
MPSLRMIGYGAAAIPADLLDRAIRRLSVDFCQGYGMTETGGNVTFLGPDEHRAGAAGDAEILRTAGRAHSEAEIGVIDANGSPVPAGEPGEIVIRGEQVMAGYWRADEATATSIIDGWLRTGDIGRVDAAGRLSVVDRAKDVIITGGENVSSREVEDALSTHPDVDMTAVVGVPDEYWGEAICAVVVPRAGCSPAASDLIEHARERISAFKRPRHVLFTDALPMTTNGKIAKDQVRALARERLGGL